MEVENDSLLQDDEIVTILTNHMNNFAQAWKETNQIIGVVSKNDYAMLDDFHDTEEWCYEPRIIQKKKCSTVEIFAQFITSATAYELYYSQSERCQKNNIKITAKETDLVHVKRLGYILGPNVRLASPAHYVQDINKTAGLNHGIIEIKKQVTFERDVKSKVMMIYAIEEEAKEIDKK